MKIKFSNADEFLAELTKEATLNEVDDSIVRLTYSYRCSSCSTSVQYRAFNLRLAIQPTTWDVCHTLDQICRLRSPPPHTLRNPLL